MDHNDGDDDDDDSDNDDGGGGHRIPAHNIPGTMLEAFYEIYQVSLTATPSARAATLASFYVRRNLGFKR